MAIPTSETHSLTPAQKDEFLRACNAYRSAVTAVKGAGQYSKARANLKIERNRLELYLWTLREHLEAFVRGS